VTYAGLLAGRGVVVVSHGDLRTTYEPVSAVVQVGDVVDTGAVLGRLEEGHLGCPVLACLHWGLKRGPDYLDPARWVTGGPVRLLPVDGGPVVGRVPVESGPAGRAAGTGADVGGLVPATVPPGRPGLGTSTEGPPTDEPALRDRAGTGLPVSRRVGLGPELPARPERGPSWSLRSAEAPLGAAAVVALVAGIGLLARPRPPSPEPISGGAAMPVPVPVDEEGGPSGDVVDLDAARVRRQSG
jgi:murein DD-endopeptidase MepM/ murein hydrolase activator NlpD